MNATITSKYAATETETDTQRRMLFRAAQGASCLGIATALFLTFVWFAFPITDQAANGFRHTGDYLYTANGIPFAAAPFVLLWSLRKLQGERGGKKVAVGVWLASVALGALAVLLAASTIAGKELMWGPTYILGTLGSIVGIGLFCAGSQRLGLIPRWALWLWAFSWTVGGMLGPKGSQLLLAAAYTVLLFQLRKRGREDSNSTGVYSD